MPGTFDLGTLNTVPLSAIATGASGDVLTLPTVWSVDDPSVVTITDNGDGTAVATRVVVTSGKVTVTATVTNPDGSTVQDSLEIDLASQTPAPAGENATAVVIVPGVAS